MKKLLYTLAGLSALALMASCNKEAERPASPEGEVVTATFTVAAPEGVATKAISDGTTATNLIVAVYDETDKYLEALSTHATISGGTPTWNVSMKVVKDMTYRFVFLAKSASDNGFSTFTPATGKLAIDYSQLSANNDNADFFFVQDKFTVENSFSKTEEMHRPLAQVNFGASDLAAAAYSINTETMLTGVKLTGIHSEMSVFTGNVTSTAADVTFAQALRVDEGATEFAPNNKRIAMVYALVATDQANVTATLNVTAEGAKNTTPHEITREIANVPLKRNYRTNILGDIFTNDFNFTVNTVPGFDTPNYVKAYHWSFASVAELNTFFADFAKYDAGDIDPELVTLTAISGDESTTITLPKSPKTITISMPFVTDKTITLKYADGAADSEKPNVDFYATNLAKLETDITHSHLTILTGSVIGEGEFATSGSTLEIEEGAKVGTANIKRGNAAIAGAVENLNVMSGAVADEANNTVQVSLSRDAAVSVITLDAKADVVVVQPKGNIDAVLESNGDNRIEVKVIIKSTASESTATAKDGGSIYVVSEAEVASVAAVGKSEEDDTQSTVVIASVSSTGNPVVYTDDQTECGNSITKSENSSVAEDVIADVNAKCLLYTPDVEANTEYLTFSRVKKGAASMSFANAVAQAQPGQVIELSEDMNYPTKVFEIPGGVVVDFNGHKLTAQKVVGKEGNVIFKQLKNYSSSDDVIADGLSYEGTLENVEIWGGTYAFDPTDYTPQGIGVVVDGADYNVPNVWFVPSIPEAIVYHATQEQVESVFGEGGICPRILPTTRTADGISISLSDMGTVKVPNGTYVFQVDSNESQLTAQAYDGWLADYVVYADKDILMAEDNIPSFAIWGAYSNMAFAPTFFFDFEEGLKLPLLSSVMWSWSYNNIKSTVNTFLCGAVNLSDNNSGTVFHVELCVAPSTYTSMANAVKDGKYIAVGKYEYAIGKADLDISSMLNN